MKVWWCEEHRSTRQECLDHGTWAECRIVEMQLVPADAELQCPNCKFVYEATNV